MRPADGRWSVIVGLLAVATMPAAVVATRYSEAYELLHAGFAIPLGAVLGVVSIVLARQARRRAALVIARDDGQARGARIGRALGILGVSLAGSASVSLAVYAVLTYLGERG